MLAVFILLLWSLDPGISTNFNKFRTEYEPCTLIEMCVYASSTCIFHAFQCESKVAAVKYRWIYIEICRYTSREICTVSDARSRGFDHVPLPLTWFCVCIVCVHWIGNHLIIIIFNFNCASLAAFFGDTFRSSCHWDPPHWAALYGP